MSCELRNIQVDLCTKRVNHVDISWLLASCRSRRRRRWQLHANKAVKQATAARDIFQFHGVKTGCFIRGAVETPGVFVATQTSSSPQDAGPSNHQTIKPSNHRTTNLPEWFLCLNKIITTATWQDQPKVKTYLWFCRNAPGSHLFWFYVFKQIQ